ncbi:unnamed protein product [Paramecium pentaurelia]|uniref:Protein kinase domain-containing protein n=1 Tax=Paramecium pentaurelia TaxID=43138 RepID=A0A8S1XWS7_9CILI|nr:unnamed protein product [Paramecium pentaurelia]
MNNSENESKQSEQTQTIDYYQQLNENRNNIISNVSLLERTIFQLLKKYPEVFVYNEQQVYDGKSQGANFILENGLLLGKGAYGTVYSTVNPNNNLPAALKVQENCDFDQVIIQAEEFKIQKKIAKHFPECIIQIQNKIVISLKYMNTYRMYAYLDLGLGNLREYQIKFNKFTDLQFNNMFDCILDSIIKIHSLKIAHGDIKLENIINTQKNGWVLADFGCAIQYTTPYGEYPIVGTRVYLQKQVRGALKNNLKMFKMNLFKKDIYAFQLTMLQILYPDDNISHLQQILDTQQIVHPKIDSLYNKDYISIKAQFIQKEFIRNSQIQESIQNIDDIKMKLENNFKLSFYYKLYQDTLKLPYNKDMDFWTQTLLNIAIQDYSDREERVKQIMILDTFVDRYSNHISAQEIFEEISFEDLTKLEYDLYFDVFEKRGQKMLQLMLCQGYQTILEELNCNLKFQEAELLYIVGQWDQAKEAINSIQNVLELENDEMLLKFICLKARLNDQWINTREEIIPYLMNYKDMFQILIEWKFILMDSIWLDKSKNIVNTIYHRQNKEQFDGINSFNYKKGENQQKPIKLNFLKYIKTFYLEQEEVNQDGINIIKQMQNFNYDKYAIFYQGWICCEILQYHDIYQSHIEELIQFIEQNLEDYYFNWVIYDCYARFLTYKREFMKGKQYLYKAMKIVQNDCIHNQFTLCHHLLQLQIQENNLECIDTFTKTINFIKQMPNSNFTQFLFITLLQEILVMCDLGSQIKLKDFLDQAIQILKDQLNGLKFIPLLNYMSQKEEAVQNKDFYALKTAMWQSLPELLEATGDIYEEEVLIGFHQLFVILEFLNLQLEDETRYTSRWIQSLIILNQIGFNIKKFPKQILDVSPCLYARSCHRQGDERKLEEAKELYMFYLKNKSWFF